MNVYDFDGTIYNGDSTLDFWLYCLQKYPQGVRALPKSLFVAFMNAFHLCKREKFKESFLGFVKYVPDIESTVSAFWDQKESRIKSWYLNIKAKSDIIISASPEFLLKDICNRLGVQLIASNVNPATGRFESRNYCTHHNCHTGRNCKGEEKVHRFIAEYPEAKIDKFFSDSLSDIYLAKIATEAYLVHGNTIKKWEL